jgi:hypothetical protein
VACAVGLPLPGSTRAFLCGCACDFLACAFVCVGVCGCACAPPRAPVCACVIVWLCVSCAPGSGQYPGDGYGFGSRTVGSVAVEPVGAAHPPGASGDARAHYAATGLWSCGVCFYTQVGAVLCAAGALRAAGGSLVSPLQPVL